MKKILEVKSCTLCPLSEIVDGHLICSMNVQLEVEGLYSEIHEECPLEDAQKLTSDNSDYAKLPKINAIVDELNGNKNLGWTPEDVEPIIKVIKSIGNFA